MFIYSKGFSSNVNEFPDCCLIENVHEYFRGMYLHLKRCSATIICNLIGIFQKHILIKNIPTEAASIDFWITAFNVHQCIKIQFFQHPWRLCMKYSFDVNKIKSRLFYLLQNYSSRKNKKFLKFVFIVFFILYFVFWAFLL